MTADHPPKFVYRLATDDEWRFALESGFVPKRDIDVKDGCFHLSTREQALATAELHFKGAAELLALEIPLSQIAPHVKFELAPKRGEAFPHLYGDLKPEHVVKAIRLNKGANGFEFGDCL